MLPQARISFITTRRSATGMARSVSSTVTSSRLGTLASSTRPAPRLAALDRGRMAVISVDPRKEAAMSPGFMPGSFASCAARLGATSRRPLHRSRSPRRSLQAARPPRPTTNPAAAVPPTARISSCVQPCFGFLCVIRAMCAQWACPADGTSKPSVHLAPGLVFTLAPPITKL
jgi:hypothetical protein